MLPLRHKEEYFIMNQDIPLAKPTDGLKYEEHQLYNIWRWVCQSQVHGHDGDTIQARNLHYLKYGLGKVEYSSLAN
jgi:hypothetical protein